eukprot:3804291-Pyramimonas_sp.AAC.1
MQEVEFAAVLSVQEGCQAGTPAGGSDGSWIQARSADVSGMTSSGTTPNNGLCANDPWRAQTQQLPVPSGQPASFAPMSRATTPFGAPQSAGTTNSLQARSQSIRMDPQLYQALQATSPFASPRPLAGQPAFPGHDAAQRIESLVGQRQWMYQQVREAAQGMRRGGIDFPHASWTPPKEFVLGPNPSPDNPD